MLAERLAALVTAQESAQEEAQHLRAQLQLHEEEAKVTRPAVSLLEVCLCCCIVSAVVRV
jgi:hypothetical protein